MRCRLPFAPIIARVPPSSCARAADDRVCAWGRGEDGQLGLGSAEEQLEPTEVAALAGKRVSALACGADHTTAYSEDSQTLWSWGWGDFGRLGQWACERRVSAACRGVAVWATHLSIPLPTHLPSFLPTPHAPSPSSPHSPLPVFSPRHPPRGRLWAAGARAFERRVSAARRGVAVRAIHQAHCVQQVMGRSGGGQTVNWWGGEVVVARAWDVACLAGHLLHCHATTPSVQMALPSMALLSRACLSQTGTVMLAVAPSLHRCILLPLPPTPPCGPPLRAVPSTPPCRPSSVPSTPPCRPPLRAVHPSVPSTPPCRPPLRAVHPCTHPWHGTSWGRNQNGQLGLGTLDDALVPTQNHRARSTPLLAVTSLGLGMLGDALVPTQTDHHALWGAAEDGGSGRRAHSIGSGGWTAVRGVPLRMVAAGAEHTAAAAEDGRLYGWGWGRYGNLGLGDRLDRKLPEQVTAIESERIAQVACGWRHTIAVNGEGRLLTFGWSKYGQLGHGDFQDHLTPSPVPAMQDKRIVQVRAQPCIVQPPADRLTALRSPVPPPPYLDCEQVSGGWRHSVALDADGVVYAWGWNRVSGWSGTQMGVKTLFTLSCPLCTPVSLPHCLLVPCPPLASPTHQFRAGGKGAEGDGGDGKGTSMEDEWAGHSKRGPVVAALVPISPHPTSFSPPLLFHLTASPCAPSHPPPHLPFSLCFQNPVAAAGCGGGVWWRHTVVLSEGGNVFSWGRATSGQLGHGDTTDRWGCCCVCRTGVATSAGPGGKKDVAAAAHAEVPDAAATWVSPAERYAVVPGEKTATWVSPAERYAVVPREKVGGEEWGKRMDCRVSHGDCSLRSLMVTAHSGLSWSLMVSAHSGLSWSLMVSAHSGSLMVSAHSGLSWSLMVTAHSGLSWSLMVTAHSGLSWSLMVSAHSGLSWSLMAGEDDASVPDADAKRLKS
ncbi:unnamed protein product [Closterium sp. NIES-65]|nr:unnamed protein product [Closterium sp. NIES-65]